MMHTIQPGEIQSMEQTINRGVSSLRIATDGGIIEMVLPGDLAHHIECAWLAWKEGADPHPVGYDMLWREVEGA